MNTPLPGPKPTPDQMHAVLTGWHSHYADDPLYTHLETSFEDMADKLWAAEKALKTEQAEAMWAGSVVTETKPIWTETDRLAYGFMRAAA